MFKYYVYIESEVIVLPLVIYAETREIAYKKAVKQFRKIFKKKKLQELLSTKIIIILVDSNIKKERLREMKSIKENSKTLLLIVGGVISVIICCFIWIQTTANTAIGYEEKVSKTLSDINVQKSEESILFIILLTVSKIMISTKLKH